MKAPTYALPATAQQRAASVRVGYGRFSGTPCALAGATMGTTWSARLSLPGRCTPDHAGNAIQASLDAVVAQMSHWEPGSDLMRYNRAPQGWIELPADLRDVLDYALWLARETDGAYDPSVGALVRAWGFGAHQRAYEPPGGAAIDAARARCGWTLVRRDGSRVWQEGGTLLDLSSIAKGYGVDRMAMALEKLGVSDFLVEAGGECRACGHRPDGLPWRVAVESPGEAGHLPAVRLADAAIATSGDYRRYIEQGGRRHAHTMDPRTGRSVENAVASVSVVHAGCMQADAWATALTVLGVREGGRLAQRHGLAALFVVRTAAGFDVIPTPAYAALCE